MPLAAFAVWQGDAVFLRATWGDPEGIVPLVQAQDRAAVRDLAGANQLGEGVAQQLKARVAGATGG